MGVQGEVDDSATAAGHVATSTSGHVRWVVGRNVAGEASPTAPTAPTASTPPTAPSGASSSPTSTAASSRGLELASAVHRSPAIAGAADDCPNLRGASARPEASHVAPERHLDAPLLERAVAVEALLLAVVVRRRALRAQPVAPLDDAESSRLPRRLNEVNRRVGVASQEEVVVQHSGLRPSITSERVMIVSPAATTDVVPAPVAMVARHAHPIAGQRTRIAVEISRYRHVGEHPLKGRLVRWVEVVVRLRRRTVVGSALGRGASEIKFKIGSIFYRLRATGGSSRVVSACVGPNQRQIKSSTRHPRRDFRGRGRVRGARWSPRASSGSPRPSGNLKSAKRRYTAGGREACEKGGLGS